MLLETVVEANKSVGHKQPRREPIEILLCLFLQPFLMVFACLLFLPYAGMDLAFSSRR
jgi:hypothetical protein